MTHPPAGPHTPPPPSGPKRPTVEPLDPNTPAGLAAADSMSQALAEIAVAIWQRRKRDGLAA